MTVSPKRKRGPSDPAAPTPFAPRINTSAFPGLSSNGDPHTAPPLAPLQYTTVGSESPRTRVARQFGHLQLDAGAALPKIDFGNTPAADSTSMTSKKAKHVYDRSDTAVGHGSANHGNGGLGFHYQFGSYSPPPQPVLEIAETPQSALGSRQHPPSPPTPSSSPSVKLFLSATGGRRQNTSPLRARSPLPDLASSTSSPSSSAEPNFDPTALTWQDSEITGHEIDEARDDDGYGINGIGFRPTHAVAQHRALKRRQQILEWRAREAREARQKRSERRRLGAGAAASPSSSLSERKMAELPKRAVRFAS
ncbi:hypothetical protein HDK77DRAFT_478095 [Phyllosticta capitalensis]